MRIETIAVHAGHRVDPATGAVAPPISLSTTFERDPDGSYPRGHLYARNSNPNRDALEACLAELEAGAAAAAFASGTAATLAVFHTLAPGDHVIAPRDVYHGTARLLREHLAPWGLAATFVDMTDVAAARAALTPRTRAIWVETPSNPMLKISDVQALADLAHGAGALCVCDNTFATPILQRPFTLGADLVVHATTKYLSGHGDVMGGAVVARARAGVFDAIRAFQAAGGGVPSPFDCWLALRSIRSAPYRVRAHAENALKVATFLARHPRVERVHYPGLPGHPGHALARRQMSHFGGMTSFQVAGGRDAAMAAAAKVRVIIRATSFGGMESLIEHRASIEGPGTTTPENLLRLSVGLEHPDDIIDDLSQALG
ncbi:MAG: aminotransferase class I/II-fold pyridoxal phosphate-dependent enzyme [Candidatus Rokubacteria bacterium]|nr:aminotransferase class I/II-fold pyridoxal phosphate-dependent enzyme [Candidatus Rokubacteria bacterium]MBI3825698.1 aminotransferase class I/II-fold pyridoxal phosphate-dependent enzyme [Candidatus Rokubacteria bacterium]